MQAVFLAAGQGTRLRPITLSIPKPLIKINNKSLLEHNLHKLPLEIEEIIIVVNYLAEQIKNYFGDSYRGRKIKYVNQEALLGTGHAIHQCRDVLRDKFLVLMGDDIYAREDIEKCIKHKYCMLVKKIDGEFMGGNVVVDKNNKLLDIQEGGHNSDDCLLNTGLYVLTKIFLIMI